MGWDLHKIVDEVKYERKVVQRVHLATYEKLPPTRKSYFQKESKES